MIYTHTECTFSDVQEENHVEIDWDAFFKKNQKKIYYFIRNRVNSHEDANDILQMIFLEAFRNKHKFNGLSKPETWVYGIAKNVVMNHYRTSKFQTKNISIDDAGVQFIACNQDPHDITANNRILVDTLQIIQSLPEDLQTMITCFVEDDMTYQEIAIIMDIPIGTVRSRFSRIRELLRTKIFNNGSNEH